MESQDTTIDRLYQRIGEFVVSFQDLEHRFREIGWLLMDPHRREWPPTQLRNLTNRDLLNRVRGLYIDTVATFPGNGSKGYCESFGFVIDEAHRARTARNALLHSAFVELKGGGEVLGILRLNPRLVIDEDREHEIDSEVLSDDRLSSLLASLAPLTVAANMHYTQLIHWLPFDPRPCVDDCGLCFHIHGLPFSKAEE